MITLAVYLFGVCCITLALHHRLQSWAILHTTRVRISQLFQAEIVQRDVATTLTDLARSLRSGMTLRAGLLEDANRQGSLFPPTVIPRLTRGDVMRDVCHDELPDSDVRLTRAIELADISGLNAADVLDVASEAVRDEHDLTLLSYSAGSHAHSTIAVLTGCSTLALLISTVLSSTVRHFIGSPLGVVLVAAGLLCNFAARTWINREIHRSTSGDTSPLVARDVILTLECLVLSGYSLQGAVMTAHTWLRERSIPFARTAEMLHAGHTVEAALDHLEYAVDDYQKPIVHGLRLAHHDGGPVHAHLATIRQGIMRAEEHRLTSAIQRTPVRLVIPLVACGLPSFLCIGVIPVLVAILGGLTTTSGV